MQSGVVFVKAMPSFKSICVCVCFGGGDILLPPGFNFMLSSCLVYKAWRKIQSHFYDTSFVDSELLGLSANCSLPKVDAPCNVVMVLFDGLIRHWRKDNEEKQT